MSASVALVVIFSVLTWAVYAYRSLLQRSSSTTGIVKQSKPLLAATGIANTLLYILAVWLMVMFAFSLLWAGGGMIAAKATMDGANTLAVVDDTLPKLIKTAVGIDPAKTVSLVYSVRHLVDVQRNCFPWLSLEAVLASVLTMPVEPNNVPSGAEHQQQNKVGSWHAHVYGIILP